jgi:hypothetical protein
MSKPLVSVVLTSNRPHLWKTLYEEYNKCNIVDFEIIVAGPNASDYVLPTNFKHIMTNDIKPAQCVEIAIRAAQGDFITFTGDDCTPQNCSLDDFYIEYNDMENDRGNDNFYFAPFFRFGNSHHSTPYRRRIRDVPHTSFCGILIKKKWMDKVGSIDKRFLCIYWDIDLAMRFYEMGVVPVVTLKGASMSENKSVNIKGERLSNVGKNYDRNIVDSFWVRDIKEGEKVPSDTAWCNFFSNTRVLSKYRVKDVEGFDPGDITLKTQGVKKCDKLTNSGRELKWE